MRAHSRAALRSGVYHGSRARTRDPPPKSQQKNAHCRRGVGRVCRGSRILTPLPSWRALAGRVRVELRVLRAAVVVVACYLVWLSLTAAVVRGLTSMVRVTFNFRLPS